MYEILSSLAEWDAEDFMGTPSTFNMRKSYVLKYQIYYPDTPTYMEALSVEHTYEYYKIMDDKIQSPMIRDIWDIFLRN